MDIKGLKVEKVLVTSKINILEEYYLGIVLDRKTQAPIVMVSKEGGIDIEEVAATAPEKIIQYPIDMHWGLRPFEARDVLARAGLPQNVMSKGGAILTALATATCGRIELEDRLKKGVSSKQGKRMTKDEGIFPRFAREGAASGRSGPPAPGDCDGLRGLAGDHQAVSQTATRERHAGSQSHPRAAIAQIGTGSS